MQLSLEGIQHQVGPATHLYPLDLQLQPGTVTVLLGATQAGKTTLMHLLHDHILRSSDHVRVCMVPPWDTSLIMQDESPSLAALLSATDGGPSPGSINSILSYGRMDCDILWLLFDDVEG